MNLKNLTDKQRLTAIYICFVLTACFFFTSTLIVQAKASSNKEELTDHPMIEEVVVVKDYEFKDTTDLYELKQLITLTGTKRDAAYSMEQSARILEHNDIIGQALIDYQYNLDANAFYTERYDYIIDTHYSKLYEKYPYATKIWTMLKEYGYNDYVCAGILGNVMAEVGGQTLVIRESVWSSNPDYYGICQWRLKYYPGVAGLDLEGQVNYLLSNIEAVFKTYGDYNEFINCTDEKVAALTFAKVYERCGSASYNIRQVNATKALETFKITEVNEEQTNTN